MCHKYSNDDFHMIQICSPQTSEAREGAKLQMDASTMFEAQCMCYLGRGKRGVKRHPHNNAGQNWTITQCCCNVGPALKTVGQH